MSTINKYWTSQCFVTLSFVLRWTVLKHLTVILGGGSKANNSVGISGKNDEKITVGGVYQGSGIVQYTGWSLEINTKIQRNSQTHWKISLEAS